MAKYRKYLCQWCGYETSNWQAFEDHKVLCEDNKNIIDTRENFDVIDFIEEFDDLMVEAGGFIDE